jgi:hypothetical protein
MRQSEARDLRSFLAESVEEIVVEGAKVDNADVGVQFINGTETQLHGAGVRFAAPWEGTGGQLHEVWARFTEPLTPSSSQNDYVGVPFTSPWETTLVVPGSLASSQSDQSSKDDLTFQQTMPIPRIPELSGAQSGLSPLSPLRPHRLQRYQSRGVPVSLSRSTSGTLRLRPAGHKERRATADLAPAPQKIVPGESSPALQSWERRRRTIYTWLVLLTLFLLVVLGGIGLDSFIANYR